MKPGDVKLAAIYTRISESDEQVDKPADQEAALRELAEREGYRVVDVFTDDDVSAFEGRKDRPGFRALVGAAATGKFHVVMATEPQRFTRGSATELEALNLALVKSGAVLHTIRAGVQDPSTPMVRGMLQMQDILAWIEVAVAQERQRDRHSRDRARGIPHKGIRPFGWESDRVTVRETEAVHIREAYRAILDRGATVWSIAQRWNTLGLRTEAMGRMRRSKADPSVREPSRAVWTTTTVRQLLVRKRNAGLLVHKGEVMPNSTIEAIVTPEDLEALEAALAGEPSQPGPKPQYLLGGLLICACGARMHATKSVSARRGGKRSEYRVYRCRLYGQDKSQKHATIQLHIADAVVRDWIVEDVGLGEIEGGTLDSHRLSEIQEELARLNTEEARGTDALLEGLGNVARIRGRLKDIKAARERLHAERDKVLGESAFTSALATFKEALEALADLAPNYEIDAVLAQGFAAWDGMTVEQRRAIIRGKYNIRVELGGRGAERVHVEKK